MMRYIYTQSGAALIILLTVFVLGSISFLLSQLNERTHFKLDDQRQTIRALNQAKEALLGYAATYAQNHQVKLPGYLPYPDMDGDGSSDNRFDKEGEQLYPVIGRLPWRTLGLPPLRDGSGECLWYALSGHFKNNNLERKNQENPPPPLTSDTNGTLIVKSGQKINNDQGEIIDEAISDEAIAIVFAPSQVIQDQDRSASNLTECGNAEIENYLDKYSYKEIIVDNVTVPEFISASPVYESDGNEGINKGVVIFNDTLIAITPKDFKPVYREMDYQVATQVKICLERAAQKNLYHFINAFDSFIDKLDEDGYLTVEDGYLTTKNQKGEAEEKYMLSDVIRILLIKQIDITKFGPDKFQGTPYPKYPWASPLDQDYVSEIGTHFGRIPTKPIFFKNSIAVDLLKTQEVFIDILEKDIRETKGWDELSKDVPDEFDKFKNGESGTAPSTWPQLWENEFESKLSLPEQWPIDPQWPFWILDLHNLEYTTMKNDITITTAEIQETIRDMRNILKESTATQAKANELNKILELPESERKEIIEELEKISTTNDSIWLKVFDNYRCFRFSGNDQKFKWWWWQEWRERVFFAIHSDYSPDNSSENPLTFKTDRQEGLNTEGKKVNIHAEMLVLVAGRALVDLNQDRTQTTDLKNYLEDENSDGDTHFEHKPMTDTFNDVVL